MDAFYFLYVVPFADTYLLKSLDSFDFDSLNNARLVLIPCGGVAKQRLSDVAQRNA